VSQTTSTRNNQKDMAAASDFLKWMKTKRFSDTMSVTRCIKRLSNTMSVTQCIKRLSNTMLVTQCIKRLSNTMSVTQCIKRLSNTMSVQQTTFSLTKTKKIICNEETESGKTISTQKHPPLDPLKYSLYCTSRLNGKTFLNYMYYLSNPLFFVTPPHPIAPP
jgi:ubiquinone biosynthesis protein Coq4